MRAAALDLGTNSVLLAVAESRSGKKLKAVCELQKITRLGKGLQKTGRLSRAGISRTLNVVSQFKDIAERHGAKKIWVIGTEALRSAKNREEFVQKLQKETGLNLEIISGKKEAELGLRGARHDLSGVKSKVALIDIGG